MAFSLPDFWVWDFWTAIDGPTVHLYYLRAPVSLVDPHLRHRNASVGHATSLDYVNWTDHGVVLEHGEPGAADETATWTGSVYRDPSGLWRMYYTGSRYLRAGEDTNIETVLMATSNDLHEWVKASGVQLSASHPWYETLADYTWREEAWRDPWVVPDAAGDQWHMLITARSREIPTGDDPADRGVIGHAISRDLDSWTAAAPISAPGAGFAHLEVPQLVLVDGKKALIFSCDSSHLVGKRAGGAGGVWALALGDADPFSGGLVNLDDAQLIVGDELYAGRVVETPAGPALLGFENVGQNGEFVGRLSDPLPLRWSDDGRLVAFTRERVR
ncbi:glycosyl hydrolase family 32 [Agreia bicolorata]|uniref:Glycosyl hydrolase family 32 n=1 Tax=Agreia bicolorata TaxID=110935 RepID=A0ABR5CBJ2_9MICO|nr:glycosyl hydrolase family 32 [Agreia bicolorata]KJC62999.1 glycosyl hydrolase family 32 [Agreia bicolorata]